MELQALKAELSRLKQEADNAREIYLRLKKEEVAAGTVLSSVDAYYAGLRVKAALTALSDFVLLYSL
jgi:urease accessory protein UreE